MRYGGVYDGRETTAGPPVGGSAYRRDWRTLACSLLLLIPHVIRHISLMIQHVTCNFPSVLTAEGMLCGEYCS